jgi:hypothetical protein
VPDTAPKIEYALTYTSDGMYAIERYLVIGNEIIDRNRVAELVSLKETKLLASHLNGGGKIGVDTIVLRDTNICPRCGNTGLVDTGNNELPCNCTAGEEVRRAGR